MKKIFALIAFALISSVLLFSLFSCGKKSGIEVNGMILELNETRDGYIIKSVADPDSMVTAIIPSRYNDLPVVAIGREAFSKCKNLESVIIPETVKSINDFAFYQCTALREILMTGGVESIGNDAFGQCSSLKELNLPRSLKTICSHAFSSCTGLVSLEIPASVETIGEGAFYSCTSVETLVINEGVKNIELGAFNSLTSLKALEIPDSVENVGENAFYNCEKLESVIIGDGARIIDSRAFYECRSLKTVVLGDGVETIGSEAFAVTDLIQVTIGKSVAYVGRDAFSEEEKRNVYYNGDIGTWCDITFESRNSNPLCEGARMLLKSSSGEYEQLIDLVIPEGEKTIDNHFQGCTDIRSVKISRGVKIAEGAFSNCVDLVSVTIDSGVDMIQAPVFNGCYKLVEIVNNTGISDGYLKEGADNVLEVHSGESKLDERNGVVFYTLGEDTYVVDYVGKSVKVVLPDSYDGKSYRIYGNAFRNNYNVSSLTIPECVTDIDDSAFKDCWKLVEIVNNSLVEISSNVKADKRFCEIVKGTSNINVQGDFAFYYWNESYHLVNYIGDDKNVVLPESFNGGEYFINCYSFYDNHNIESVKVPSGVKGSRHFAFIYCILIDDVYVDDLKRWCSMDFNGMYANPMNNEARLHVRNSAGEYELVENLVIPAGVETLSENTFIYCSSIKTVTIGNDVKVIGGDALRNCKNLTRVDILHGVNEIGYWAFAENDNLQSITLSDTVQTIDSYAFFSSSAIVNIAVDENSPFYKSVDGDLYSKDGTTLVRYASGKKLEEFVITANVKRLAENSILSDNIKRVYYEGDIYAWCNLTFEDGGAPGNHSELYLKNSAGAYELVKDLTLPKDITEIKDYAFYFIEFENIVLHDNVKSIGKDAFNGTTYFENRNGTDVYVNNYLLSVNIGKTGMYRIKDGTTVIAKNAFDMCDEITELFIPDSVTAIPEDAFCGMNNLKKVTIGNGVEIIGKNAFSGCTSLEAVTMGENVKTIGDEAFERCSSLSEITISNSVKMIGASAFAYCDNLSQVNIGKNVESIGAYAFWWDVNLKEITLPESLQRIEERGFSQSGLISITIPKNVNYIGKGNFYDCKNLVSVKLENKDGWTAEVNNENKVDKVTFGEELANDELVLKYLTTGMLFYTEDGYCGYTWTRK